MAYLYHALRVPSSASQAEIEEAYRRAIARSALGGSGLLSWVRQVPRRELLRAYEVLRDPASRRRYDEQIVENLRVSQGMPPPP